MYVYVLSLGLLTATEHYNIYRSQIYFGASIDICSFSSERKQLCGLCQWPDRINNILPCV